MARDVSQPLIHSLLSSPQISVKHPTSRTRRIEATAMPGIQWLLDAPQFERIIIGEDGWPLRLVVPEPRTFALHKLWVSRREDRDPLKRRSCRAISSATVDCKGDAVASGGVQGTSQGSEANQESFTPIALRNGCRARYDEFVADMAEKPVTQQQSSKSEHQWANLERSLPKTMISH
jgi:hypothetical protein